MEFLDIEEMVGKELSLTGLFQSAMSALATLSSVSSYSLGVTVFYRWEQQG